MIARKTVDDVIHAAAIDEVVGEYIALKKRGSNLLGLCPFHDEKTPSFTVSPSKGIYKCFGCGKAGNAVSFVMEHDSLTFAETIRKLAARYNITVEEDHFGDKEEYNEQQKKRESLLVALEFARKFFIQQLATEEGKRVAETYFRERGFTGKTIADFDLGYSPQSWESLVNEAERNKFNLEVFAEAGLIKKKEDGKYFDLFRHRVIFPIHDLTGQVIAFGGRQLVKDERSPKYLNSPETDVYHKSNVLYGIFQAKKQIRNQNNCYLVEGYTDVTTLHQAGVENVVASSGTSLTEGQIRLIRRFTENVTVLYDGDAAGIKASLRGIDLLLEQGLNVRCVPFPEGEDPDSYCKSTGASAFIEYLKTNQQDFIIFKTNLLMQGVGNDPIRKTEVVRNLLTSIALIPDALKRATYAKECGKLMESDEKLLLSEIARMRRSRQVSGGQKISDEIREILHTPTDLPKQEVYTGGNEQERDLVRLLIQSGHKKFMESATVADFIFTELRDDDALQIEDPLYKKVLEEVKKHMESDLDIAESFFINHQDGEIRKLAADFMAEKHELSPAWSDNGIYIKTDRENYVKDLQSLFLFLKKHKLEKLIRSNLEEFATAKEEPEKEQHLQYHMQLIDVRNTIAELLGAVVHHN